MKIVDLILIMYRECFCIKVRVLWLKIDYIIKW